MEAIAKARAWYSGERLVDDSGSPFWEARDPANVQDGRVRKWDSFTPIRRSHRVHVPIAADLASTAADFLFGGGLSFESSDSRVAEAAEASQIVSALTLAGERASGLGEVYLRLGWDDDNGLPALCTVIDADRVLPEFRWGRFVGGTIWAFLPEKDGQHFIHLERHSPGKMQHSLWKCDGHIDPIRLTGEVPLAEHDATEMLEPEVELPFEESCALLYVPNAEPRSPRIGGRSDTEGSESIMSACDEAMSSLERDIRLGKGRIVVDENMLTRTGQLAGAHFDMSGEVFSPVGSSGITGDPIKPVQFDIRTTAHLEAVQSYIQRVVSTAGYSPESLTMSQSGLPESAAARRLRESASIRTTERKVQRWRPVIAEALSLLAVIYDDSVRTRPLVQVAIRPAITLNAIDVAEPVASLLAARAISIQTAVALQNPTWTETQVGDEVARIKADGPPAPPPGV